MLEDWKEKKTREKKGKCKKKDPRRNTHSNAKIGGEMADTIYVQMHVLVRSHVPSAGLNFLEWERKWG